MPEEDLVDIKFRLYDGSDIGPFRYAATATVDTLKQRIVSDWPKGKTVVPKSANEVKLISSGKILENNKTVGQCKVPFGEIAGGVIIMHVVVQPSLAKTKAGLIVKPNINVAYDYCIASINVAYHYCIASYGEEKKIDDSPKKVVCSCSIL